MFFRFMDHRVQLFLMVANHRPSDAMYRSSLMLVIRLVVVALVMVF